MPSFVLSYFIGLVFSLAFAYLVKNGCASLAASVAAFQPLHSAILVNVVVLDILLLLFVIVKILPANLLPRLRKVFSFVRRAPQATAVDVNRGVVYEDPSRRQDFSFIFVLILAVQLQLLTSVLTASVSLEDSGESQNNIAEKEGAPPVDQIHVPPGDYSVHIEPVLRFFLALYRWVLSILSWPVVLFGWGFSCVVELYAIRLGSPDHLALLLFACQKTTVRTQYEFSPPDYKGEKNSDYIDQV
ncbi:hypothetical protein K438DRAFT_1804509, partial [Mycena galopus ATCC 62051]